MENIDNYFNRLLGKEKGLFSYNRSLRYLWGIGISTIGDLLNNKERVFGIFLTDKRIRKDIIIAIKLLECKYLGIDPKIEITEEDSMETIGDKLGFSKSTKTAFVASEFRSDSEFTLTPQIFKNIIKNSSEIEAREKLLSVKEFGKIRVDEIYYKSSIVLNYDRNNVNSTSTADDLSTKYLELLGISKKVKELDAEIDSMLDEMLENMVGQESKEEEKTYTKSK